MEPTEILQSLFDSKVVNILKLFLREEGKQFYLREIAKLAKVSPASTYRILKKLTELQVLKMTEIKTAKLYNLEANKTVDFLRNLIEVDVVSYFTEKAGSVNGVEEILILGTREKTKANLLILGTAVDINEIKRICGEVKDKYSFTINQMTLTKEQYEQMSAMGLYPGSKKVLYRKAIN